MGQRIVIKIGSQVLCDPHGELNREVLGSLVDQAGRLVAAGSQVLIVSSGAVAAGMRVFGFAELMSARKLREAGAHEVFHRMSDLPALLPRSF